MDPARQPPRTRYAKSGDAHIAYQVVGDGPIDIAMVPGFVSNVEHYWEMPKVPELLGRVASFSRLILWDKRGTGLSDPVVGVPALEERIDDLKAVLDAVGSERTVLWGVSEGGPMSVMFAATYPERTSELILYGTTPRFSRAPDFPHGWPDDFVKGKLEQIEESWGEGALMEMFAPSYADDPMATEMWGRYQRAGGSPAMARRVLEALAEIDVREILRAVNVPTLILHRTGEHVAAVEGARYMAEHIPGARLVELEGTDHLPMFGDSDAIVDEMEEFLTGERRPRPADRVLSTVLFTDIVGSTERAAELGDSRWRELLARHDELVRRQLTRFDGREVKHTGDGFLATFDGPARGVRCARDIAEAVRQAGLEIRAGLHTGECELRAADIGGMAVHIAARVMALAQPGEVLASSTVKDLVVGSGLQFADRGVHPLKGVPDEWRLYAASG
ncbi:MAG TPA: adenylate/guanylate cyclase domain-containing protein [Thermoleophilaceae bacterium]|nr:adenylate/guanylate cyclase domain-containing protein [Thermoleophilaceae bacterium]